MDFEIGETKEHLTDAGLKAAGLTLADPDSVLVVVRSGILKHTLPLAINTRQVAVNQDVKVLSLTDDCLSRYLGWFLRCFQDRILRLVTKHSTTVQSVNTSEFMELPVPLPSIEEQGRIVESMDAYREQRNTKQVEADALLAGLDYFLLDTLEMRSPAHNIRHEFAVCRRAAQQRFDPHFHSPEFAMIQEMLSQTQCESLGSIATFSKEIWRPQDHEQPTFRYVEISTVDPKTGEAHWNEVPTEEAPSRARMAVQADDIIVSLTRPHHGSIAHLDADFDGCVASTGFAVIREVATHVRRDYLWCVLRAQFCLSQMLQRASGGNYPAITEQELTNIIVPVPSPDAQDTIATEVHRCHKEAARLRAEAGTDWQAAKQWFEERLLEPNAL